MPKLSFIVPIYNVEQYLRKCVESLLHQDYDNFEIILVDDGSPDNSGRIADELAIVKSEEVKSKNEERRGKNGPEIRVIHQENRGLSGARNSGIEVANGEYLCFVDSDDYWEENVLGELMAQIERDNLDVLRFRWQNVREVGGKNEEVSGKSATTSETSDRLNGVNGEEGKTYEVFKPYKEENFVDFSSEPLNGLDYLNQRMGIQCYAWSFIVRTEIVKSERFSEGILFEDTDWTPRMLVKANRVAGTETIVYNYLWRESGITLSKSPEKLRKELDDKLALAERLATWGDSKWYKQMVSALIVSVIGLLGYQMYEERKNYLKQIKHLDVLPLSKEGQNKKAQRKIRIINLSPTLAVWMLHIKNN